MDFWLGTASWSAASWQGVFYPPGMPPGEYLCEYSRHFRTVEVDATYYRSPPVATVEGWYAKTPPGFIFAAKVPQTITHEKVLVGCEQEMEAFLAVMARLREKQGPLLLQFPYFKKAVMSGVDEFMERLAPFLAGLPPETRFALEVRNRTWLVPPFLELLRHHRVALALIDHPWMPTAAHYRSRPELITTDFGYVRWLGDRYKIEEQTTEWNRLVVDRQQETLAWVDAIDDFLRRTQRVYGYYNNHYAGFGVGSARLFEEIWEKHTGTRLPTGGEPTVPGE
jgi:uncharacterized protein YecE (DUF72 family)